MPTTDPKDTGEKSRRAGRICVLSGRYPESFFKSVVNHRAYCARHGYSYIHCNWPTGNTNRYMNKMEYVREYYHLFDYIFWIDDDAFFIDLDQALEPFVPDPGNFLSICASPDFKQVRTYISSGQFMLECSDTGRAFVDAVMLLDLSQVRAWWDESLGYFSNGDQDGMVYLLKTDSRFSRYNRHDYQTFNSRVENLLAGDKIFILHFTGPAARKRRGYRLAQKHLRRGPSLLAREEIRRWNLKKSGLQRVLSRARSLVGRLMRPA
jgi:hypothetical protein